MSVQATGIFKNFNTIEDFKAADKAALVNGVVSKVRS
jgi:ubiquitin-like modifier-activating enzyme ATG7